MEHNLSGIQIQCVLWKELFVVKDLQSGETDKFSFHNITTPTQECMNHNAVTNTLSDREWVE